MGKGKPVAVHWLRADLCQRESGVALRLPPHSIVLEFDGIVHHSALGATRKIDIGIISVNISTSSAAINAIFTFGRLKAASPQFSVDSNDG
jgi:hypothetical protein